MIAPLTAACLAAVAAAGDIPERAMYALLATEGGQVGRASVNRDGSRDLGPFQINERWASRIAAAAGLPGREAAIGALRDDGCFNALAAASILSLERRAAGGDLAAAIGRYHSATAGLAAAYRGRFEAHYRMLFGAMTLAREASPRPIYRGQQVGMER